MHYGSCEIVMGKDLHMVPVSIFHSGFYTLPL